MNYPQFKVAGTLRDCLFGTLTIQRKLGARDTTECTLLNLDDSWRPEVGQTLSVLNVTTEIWSGLISSFEEKSFIGDGGPMVQRVYIIQAVSWEHRLDRRCVYDSATGLGKAYSRNYLFTADPVTDVLTAPGHGRTNGDMVQVKTSANGTLPWHLESNVNYYVRDVSGDTLKLAATVGGAAIDLTDAGDGRHKLITYRAGEIVSDLLTTYAAGEEIVEAETQNGAVVDKAIFDGCTVAEAIKQLADLSGFISWVDKDKGHHFVARSTVNAPFSITDSSENFYAVNVSRSIEAKFNDALMRAGWDQFPVTEEIFDGDGATRDWTLTKPAVAVSYVRTYGSVDEFVFTVNAGTDLLTAAGHTATEGQRVRVRSTTTLPSPLSAGVEYYARDVSGDDLKLAYWPGGEAIDITDVGTGTHYLICYRSASWYESTFGIDDQEVDKDFYWDPGMTTIRQDGTRSVLDVGARVAVGYWPLGSNLIPYEDAASILATAIAEGGSGRYTRAFDRSDSAEGQLQALAYGMSLVSEHKETAIEITYGTTPAVEPLAVDLMPGQLQNIALTAFGIVASPVQEFLIDEVTITADELLRYKVHATSRTYYADWLQYYRDWVAGGAGNLSLMGGGSGGGLGGGGGGVPAGGILKIEMTLIAPSTEVVCPYAATEGTFLVVYLTQDATGGREVTWPLTFNVPETGLDPTALTTSAFAFVARADGKWWPFAPPITCVLETSPL